MNVYHCANRAFLFLSLASNLATAGTKDSKTVLVEAEQFAQRGGWTLDTQFIESMGSPYLLAHGLGQPVRDASTSVVLAQSGNYRVWVRTLDWSKRLNRAAGAGGFTLAINGETLPGNLGEGPIEWTWRMVGERQLTAGRIELALRDLNGFDGRVDALLLSCDPNFQPGATNSVTARSSWAIQGAPEALPGDLNYDLVVIGGGYGGLGAAISAARMGCKVALVQNRPVLGGNGSSEVRVWAMGDMPPSEYRFDDIIKEIQDNAKSSPAAAEQFVDDKKEKVVRAEKNITLLLEHHAYAVTKIADRIRSVAVLDVKTGQVKTLTAPLFVDATGHGFIGQWAGADRSMTANGRMGMSNMWTWENSEKAEPFAEQPWMLTMDEKAFPYPRRGHAEWFWESGFDKHPIDDLEKIRDWNLLASFSAWNAMKNHRAHASRDPQAHQNAKLTWLAAIGGTRETQQILGDVILDGTNIEEKTPFDDGCVLTTWSIDLHIPHPNYKNFFPDNPFISKDIHRASVDKRIGYAIPYRCFYSRNVPNLFTAGRNISVTRDALGTVRVMKTIGMMGVAVGRAAALCRIEQCEPRAIHEKHLATLKELWRMPGKTRYASLKDLQTELQSGH